MKPLLTSACSARRPALRLNPSRTLGTPSSVFEVSEQKMFFLNSIIDHRNDLIQLLPGRVWHRPFFGFLGGFVVAVLRRLPQQVISIHFYCFTDHYFTILMLFFLLFFEGVKFFSTLLVSALAQLPLSSSFSSFLPAFCQRWSILRSVWGPVSSVSCVTNVLFVFLFNRKVLFICSLLAAGHFLSMPSSSSSGISA